MNNPKACPFCFVSEVSVSQVGGDAKRAPAGSITVCDECLQISMVEEGGSRRPLTGKEMHELVLSDSWLKVCAAQKAIAIVKQRHPAGGQKR